MDNTHKAPIDTVVDAAQEGIDQAVKEAANTAAESTSTDVKQDDIKSDVKQQAEQESREPHGSHRAGCVGNRGDCGGCGHRCRAGKWLAIFALMLASGVIGGLIGGKIGGHGGHGGHDRMSRHGGMMMQQDGERGGMRGPMGLGMQQGAPMVQPSAGQQATPPAPTNPVQPEPTR